MLKKQKKIWKENVMTEQQYEKLVKLNKQNLRLISKKRAY